MQITRSAGARLFDSISTLIQNENFSITTKYKVLKIKEILEEEMKFNKILMEDLAKKYGSIDEEGNIFINKDYMFEANKELEDFNSQLINLPDLKFTLDELGEETKWSELEAFLPFIKD